MTEKGNDMMNRAVKISVGIMLSIGLLLSGYFLLNQINEKEDNQDVTEVSKLDNTVNSTDIEEEKLELDHLPNAEEEIERWNEAAKEFTTASGPSTEYNMNLDYIQKNDEKSNDEVTVFSHDFDTSLETSIEYSVNNETKEIIKMRLIGYEKPNADRAAIFYTMSIFISYVDQQVNLNQAENFLGEIPFATNEEGLYEVEFNGKRYDYVLDLDGLNMLVYRVNE